MRSFVLFKINTNMKVKCCVDCTQEIKPEELVAHTPRCIECRRKKATAWRNNNKERLVDYYRKYRKTEKCKEMVVRWRNNPEYKKKYRERAIERLKEDSAYRLCHNCRSIINGHLKKNKLPKTGRTAEYIGTNDFEFLKSYLEKKFQSGMTWENWGKGKGKWNIDHIIPLASASNEEELIKLLHYTNLQPLWSDENGSKGSLYEGERHVSFTCRK